MWKEHVEDWILSELPSNMHNKQFLTAISQNPFLPLQLVIQHPYLPWDFHALRKNPYLTKDIVKQLQERYHRRVILIGYHLPAFQLFHGCLSCDFRGWENCPTRFWKMSCHPLLPLALVVRMPNKSWNYPFLLRYRKWTVRQISMLKKQKKMDWKAFSGNVFLNRTMLEAFLDRKWNWKHLARHPAFPPQDIYQDPILFPRWKWRFVFMNPRITPTFWQSLHKKYHKPFILSNRFQFSEEVQLYSSMKIQDWLFQCVQRRNILCRLAYLKQILSSLPLDICANISRFI